MWSFHFQIRLLCSASSSSDKSSFCRKSKSVYHQQWQRQSHGWKICFWDPSDCWEDHGSLSGTMFTRLPLYVLSNMSHDRMPTLLLEQIWKFHSTSKQKRMHKFCVWETISRGDIKIFVPRQVSEHFVYYWLRGFYWYTLI